MKKADSALLFTAAAAATAFILFSGEAPQTVKTTVPWETIVRKYVKDYPESFIIRLKQICALLGIDPLWLVMVMYFESGLNSKIVNTYKNPSADPEKGATGLIQFMPSTAKGLGTTNTALQNMTNVKQLDYVYYYLLPYKNKMKRFVDVYMSVFFPLAIGKPTDWVIQSKNLTAEQIAKANPIFDIDKNGSLTVGEVQSIMTSRMKKLAA